jgi:hypothetical protein
LVGDNIKTVVSLSQDGDISFEVRRNDAPVLTNQPGVFHYEDVYTVAEGDGDQNYTYTFTFADDTGSYALTQFVDEVLANGDTRDGADGRGPFISFHLFERR